MSLDYQWARGLRALECHWKSARVDPSIHGLGEGLGFMGIMRLAAGVYHVWGGLRCQRSRATEKIELQAKKVRAGY